MSDNNVTRPPARSGGLPARSQASPESREQPQEQPQPAHQQRHQQQQQEWPSRKSMDPWQAPTEGSTAFSMEMMQQQQQPRQQQQQPQHQQQPQQHQQLQQQQLQHKRHFPPAAISSSLYQSQYGNTPTASSLSEPSGTAVYAYTSSPYCCPGNSRGQHGHTSYSGSSVKAMPGHQSSVSLNASDLEIQRIKEQDRLDEEMLDEMFKGLERDELQLRAADVNQGTDIVWQTVIREMKERAQQEAAHEKTQKEQPTQASLNASGLEIMEEAWLDGEDLNELAKDLERQELQIQAAEVNQRADIDEQTFSRPLKERAQHEAAHEKKKKEQLTQMFGDDMLPVMGATGTLYSGDTAQSDSGSTGMAQMGAADLSATADTGLPSQASASLNASGLEFMEEAWLDGEDLNELAKDLERQELQIQAAEVNQRADIDEQTFSRPLKERAQQEAAHEKKEKEQLTQMFGDDMLPEMGATGTLYFGDTAQSDSGSTGMAQMGAADLSATADTGLPSQASASLNASGLEFMEEAWLDGEDLNELAKDLERQELQIQAAEVNQGADIDEQTFSRPLKERAQHEAAHEKKKKEQLTQMFGDDMLPGMDATGTLYSGDTAQSDPGSTGMAQMGAADLSATADTGLPSQVSDLLNEADLAMLLNMEQDCPLDEEVQTDELWKDLVRAANVYQRADSDVDRKQSQASASSSTGFGDTPLDLNNNSTTAGSGVPSQMFGDGMPSGMGATGTSYSDNTEQSYPGGTGMAQMGAANLSATADAGLPSQASGTLTSSEKSDKRCKRSEKLEERRKHLTDRERERVHEITQAYKELGKCLPNDLTGKKVGKEKTKLNILQEAVQVIYALEEKVLRISMDQKAQSSLMQREQDRAKSQGDGSASGDAGHFKDDPDDDSSDRGQGAGV
ncbi:uncharacterized protein LOC135814805 isoform X4 [Sycon ciliatum]|uniref:uncharacterized protein LOC135814805 isoform X4 n=1 Tax=Sycon ciliatum TaxID=27933 RepID=UPI0031F65B08